MSSLWVGFFDFEDAPAGLPLPSLCLPSLSLWRRSLRLRSASGSTALPDLSTNEESELRLGLRCLASGGSAKMSSPCAAPLEFPPFNCLCCSSSFDRVVRCPVSPFLTFATGGTFSVRIGRDVTGGAAGREMSPLGLSSRDRLFFVIMLATPLMTLPVTHSTHTNNNAAFP